MNKLENDVVLKFRLDTLEAVRKEYDLNRPGVLKESIDLLENWVAAQAHFVKKDFAREYLERTIIICKGSIERAKLRLDKSCTIRSLLPQYFEMSDAKTDIGQYDNYVTCAILPQLTEKNERVVILKNMNYSGPAGFFGCYKYIIKMLEYVNKNDLNTGFIFILDYTTMNIKNLLSYLNMVELRQLTNILLEGYGLRLRKFYILSSSKMIDTVVTILKQVLTSKLSKRIQVFKDYKDLHNELPMEILPEDYEGKERSCNKLHEDLIKALSAESFVDYLKEMQSAVTNEDLRSSSVFNETYLGVPGSFRKIAFD